MAGLLAATIGRLCEGEVLELQDAYQVTRTEAAYLTSIEGKTASLLSSACRIGAIVAELPRTDIDRLTEFGTAYGMAFQIVDDILDVIATDEQLGKPAGHDLVEGAYNLPVLRALAGPRGRRAAHACWARPSRASAWERPAPRALVREGDAVDQSIAVAQGYVDQAVELLEPLGDQPGAVALRGAAQHLLSSLAPPVERRVTCPTGSAPGSAPGCTASRTGAEHGGGAVVRRRQLGAQRRPGVAGSARVGTTGSTRNEPGSIQVGTASDPADPPRARPRRARRWPPER